MEKFYRGSFFLVLLLWIGFFSAEKALAQNGVTIVDNAFNGCLQRTTIEAVGVGPLTFRYYREGVLEQSDTVETPGPGGTYVSQVFNLPAGSYTVMAQDANGQTDQIPLNVFLASTVSVRVLSAVDATCSGGSTGEAMLEVISNSNFVVRLYERSSPSQVVRQFTNTENLVGLPAGEYLVEVRDAVNCVAFEELVIEEPDPLQLAEGEELEVVNPACEGDLGAIRTQMSGGMGPEYFFQLHKNGQLYRDDLWTIDGGQIAVDGLAVGQYELRVFTDPERDRECFRIYPFEITYTPKFTIQPSTTAVTCNGMANGVASLFLQGDLAFPFVVEYGRLGEAKNTLTHASSATLQLEGLAPGQYQVQLRDQDGCTISSGFSIEEPAELEIAPVTVTDVCFGDVNGSISVAVSGGTAPYSFALSSDFTGAVTQMDNRFSFEGLVPGAYQVFVRDLQGCMVPTEMIHIRQPEASLGYELLTLDHPNCPEAATGKIEILASGGWEGPYQYRWTRPGSDNVLSTTATLENVPAGEYQLQLTDQNGCSDIFDFELSDPDSPEIQLSSSPVSCYGGEDGKVFVSLPGAADGYEMALAGETSVGTTAVFENLAAGAYTFSVKIAEDCFLYREVEVEQPQELIIHANNVYISPLLCNDDQNGSIAGLHVEGGTASYFYQWESAEGEEWVSIPGAKSVAIDGLGTGIYRLVVADENGCIAISRNFEFLLPLPLEVLDYRAIDAACHGGTGSVEINLVGGTAPYYFSLDGGSYSLLNQAIIPSLSPGSHLIHIRDENGCTLPTPLEVEIQQPAGILLEEITPISPSCEGGNDGGFIANISGGASGDLQFEWYREGSPVQVLGTDAQIEGLDDGRYFLKVFDSENPACAKNFGPFEVKSPPAIIAEVEKTDLSCQGDASGQLQIKNISGGGLDEGAQYQVAWTGPDFSSSELHIKELVAGEYHLTISDGRSCVFESSYTVNQPENTIAIEVLEVVEPTCFEGSNGRIEISADNGTMPYSYIWHRQDTDSGEFVLLEGQMSSFLHSVQAGTYQVTVADHGGCTAVKEIVVGQPDPLRVTLSEKGDVTCFDRNDGFITVDITGGSGAYTFSWSNGQTNQNLSDLRAGDYRLQVFDQNGCRVTSDTFTIAPVARPQIELVEKRDVVCQADGGALTIGLGQGVNPEDYDIYWLDLRSGEKFGQQQLVVEGLAVGFYQVFVEAGEACTVDRVFRVEGPEAPLRLLASQLDPGCPGQEGVIYLNATGGFPGYSYFYQTATHQAWQPLNGTVLNSLAPGDYGVKVRDAKGCEDESTLTITQPNSPSFSAEKIQGVSCYGGNDGVIAFDVTGGSHQWFKRMEGQDAVAIADAELDRLEAGTYFMEVTFAEGCKEKTHDIIISQPEALMATVEVAQLTCVETFGNASVDIQGGAGSNEVSLYHQGRRIRLQEEVYGGRLDFTELEAGEYEIHINNEGCGVQVHPFVIAAAAEPLKAEVLAEDVSCRGAQDGKISLNVANSEGVQVKLNGQLQPEGEVEFRGLSEGFYTVEILNGTCSVVEQVEISYPAPIVLTTQEVRGVSCQGMRDGFIKIAVNGDFPIRWYYLTGTGNEMQALPEFDGATEARDLRPGTYIIEAGGEGACKRSLSVPVREPQRLIFTESIVDGSCSGDGLGAIFLQVEGGTAPYRFTWSNADPAHWVNQATTRDLRNLSPGNYTVLIEDRNGCATGSTFTVSEPNPLVIQSSFTEWLSCHGAQDGYIDNHISGGVQDYQIEWLDNPNIKTSNRKGLSAGTYTIRVTDQNRCLVEKSFEIKEPQPLVAELFTRIDIQCDTREVVGNAWLTVEGGTGEYEIRWNSGEANVREVNFNRPGDISVYVKDVNGCTIDVSRTVDFPPLFADADFTYAVISIDEPGEILVNDPIQFQDQTVGNVIAWHWDFGDGNRSGEQNPQHTYGVPGLYQIQLTVYDTYGCSTMSTLAVEVTDSYRILFPNAFTPNGDGLNDTFIPKFRGISEFEMHIFNTWGELLYSTYSMEDPGWDGYHKGRPSPNGNYVYKVAFSTKEGKRHSRSGVFLLIK